MATAPAVLLCRLKFRAVLRASTFWFKKTTKHNKCMYAKINVCKNSQNKSKHPQQAKGSWKPMILTPSTAGIPCWITSNKKQKLSCCTLQQGCYSFPLSNDMRPTNQRFQDNPGHPGPIASKKCGHKPREWLSKSCNRTQMDAVQPWKISRSTMWLFWLLCEMLWKFLVFIGLIY